jgi:hypothetical protein
MTEISKHYANGESVFSGHRDNIHRQVFSYKTPESECQNYTTQRQFRATAELPQSQDANCHWVGEVYLENIVSVAGAEVGNYEFLFDPVLVSMESVNIRIGLSDYETIQNQEVVSNLRMNAIGNRNKFDFIQKHYGATGFRYKHNENETITMTGGDTFTFITPLSLAFGALFDKFSTDTYKKITLDFNLSNDSVILSNHMKFPATGLGTLTMSQKLIFNYTRIFIPSPQSISFVTNYYQAKQYPVAYNSILVVNLTQDFSRAKYLKSVFVGTTVASHAGALDNTNSQYSGSWRDLSITQYKLLIDGAEIYRTSPYSTQGAHVELLNFQEWDRKNNDKVAVSNEPSTSLYSTNRQPWLRLNMQMLFHQMKKGDTYLGHSQVSDLNRFGKVELELSFSGAPAVNSIITPGHVMEIMTEASRVVNVKGDCDGSSITYTR